MSEEMKTCPYCGEEILATAQKCKHCGEWLNKKNNNNNTLPNENDVNNNSNNIPDNVDLILVSTENCYDKVALLKEIRATVEPDFISAKRMIDYYPSLLIKNIEINRAIFIKTQLEKYGAIVAIHNTDGSIVQNNNVKNNNTINKSANVNIKPSDSCNSVNSVNNPFAQVISLVIFIVLVICGWNIAFSNPIDKLTKGCSEGGDLFNTVYYCKNKPWDKVIKSVNTRDAGYSDYIVTGSKGEASLSWYNGDWHMDISTQSGKNFEGICSNEEEFVNKVKEMFK